MVPQGETDIVPEKTRISGTSCLCGGLNGYNGGLWWARTTL